jgi:cytochrome oxidase assembly protein ShyY1
MTGDGSRRAPGRDGGRRYAFLRTPRWLRLIGLTILISLACSGAGWWQWTRHTARLSAVEQVVANYDAPPVPIQDILDDPGAPLPADDVWRPVSASGTFPAGGTVLLRNRPVSGTPALHVLAPLVVTMRDGGSAVLVVDRGWLPAGSEEEPAQLPGLPAGDVAVVVRLRAAEGPANRAAPQGQAYTVNPAEILQLSGVGEDVKALPVLAAYGILGQERPASADAPERLPRPDTDLGTHLSYTFQWWVFALGAYVGLAVLARREAAALAAPAEARARGLSSGVPGGRRRSAEQEEDALIDEQLTAAGRRERAGPH